MADLSPLELLQAKGIAPRPRKPQSEVAESTDVIDLTLSDEDEDEDDDVREAEIAALKVSLPFLRVSFKCSADSDVVYQGKNRSIRKDTNSETDESATDTQAGQIRGTGKYQSCGQAGKTGILVRMYAHLVR